MVGPALFAESKDKPVAHDGVESTLDIYYDQGDHLLACKRFFNIVDQGGYQVYCRPLGERSGLLRIENAIVYSYPR
jgi:hypothetical protein